MSVPRISSGSGWWGSPRHPMFLKYKSQWRVLVPEALSTVLRYLCDVCEDEAAAAI